MHARFRLRQSRKDARRTIFHLVAQTRAFDDLEYLTQAPMMMMLARLDVRAHSTDAGAINLLESNLKVTEIQLLKLFDQHVTLRPSADQRAQRHVAAHTSKAIEVEQTHKDGDR